MAARDKFPAPPFCLDMPWSADNPPSVAKNWTSEEQRKCIAAGNAVLRDGGSDEEAIYACIAAAGKGKEQVYMDKDQAIILAAIEAKQDAKKGLQWEVVIIGQDENRPGSLVEIDGREYIVSLNQKLFDVEALEKSVPLFEGAKVYDDHMTQEEFEARKGMRSPKNEWLGTIVSPWWDAAKRQIRGIFKVVEDQLAAKLKSAYEQDVLDSVGLSIDYGYELGKDVVLEGRRLPVVGRIAHITSVDFVGNAAAGGRFARMLAAHDVSQGANDMDKDEVKALVQEALQEALPEFTSSVAAALTAQESEDEEEVLDEVDTEEEDTEEEDEAEEEEDEDEAEAEEQEDADAEDGDVDAVTAEDALEAVRALESNLMVRDQLDASKLPTAFRTLVETQFPQGKVHQKAQVVAVIKQAREAWKATDTSGKPKGTGRGIEVGMNGQDWAQVEFLRLLQGNTKFRALESAEDDYVRNRTPQGYRSWIKAGRPKGNTRRISEWTYELLGGNPLSSQRAYEAVMTTNMTSLVKNALNVMLAASYSVKEEWWDPIVTTEEVDTLDQATLVRLYGMSTLAVVGEGDPYTELGWADDEETASFVKKGGYIPVTLEMLLNDKLNQIRTIPQRLANSWFNTLSAMNSAVFTTNSGAGPVLSDTGALFNATAATSAGGHANLLTTALGHAAYGAARLAMMKQTDQQLGAGRRLNIRPRHLLVPSDLWATAEVVRLSELQPEADFSSTTGNQSVNVYRGGFETLEVPDWTDTNNWALVADKGMWPAIYNIFLTGLRVPELFTADSDTAGAMFTNDTLRFKVRLMTWRYSSTYDCAPVADFRPLHKSNVA